MICSNTFFENQKSGQLTNSKCSCPSKCGDNRSNPLRLAIAQDERVESVKSHHDNEEGRCKLPNLVQGTCVKVWFRLHAGAIWMLDSYLGRSKRVLRKVATRVNAPRMFQQVGFTPVEIPPSLTHLIAISPPKQLIHLLSSKEQAY